MATTFDLLYYSTSDERYNTDQNRRVETLLAEEGVDVVEFYGGTEFGNNNPFPSENGYVIATDELNARRIAKRIEEMVEHPVVVTAEADRF